MESTKNLLAWLLMPEKSIPRGSIESQRVGFWSGLDAKRLGLVDGFGGLRESIQKAAELAKLEPGSFGVKEVPALQTPFQALEDMFAVSQGGFQSTSSGSSLIREITEELENALSSVQTLNDPRHAYGLLPWYRRGFGFVD